MAQKKESFFWTSYSDLMTSLFFVMLVLFILVIVLLHKRMEATEAQLQEIKKVEQSTKDLSRDYFQYRSDYKKYVLTIQVRYPAGKSDLNDIVSTDKEAQLRQLAAAGREIRDFLKNHSENQYILIIEGQASKDNFLYNYELSYQRALALMRFWIEDSRITFGSNCEILISGSGDGKLDTHSMRETNDERENQRFRILYCQKTFLKTMKINNFIISTVSIICLYSCAHKSGHGERNDKIVTSQQSQSVLVSPNKKARNVTISVVNNRGDKNKLDGSQIFSKYNTSVFMVFTSDGYNMYQGSGFFINKDGLAVSNYHVFKGTGIGEEGIKLAGSDKVYKVEEVIMSSENEDFILFRVDVSNTDFIPVAKYKPNVGEKVYAIGSPRGLENTFSSGEVSQWRDKNLMQISALIDHGSSGGALINEYGEVVGITSGSFADGSQANLNYAWSIDVIKPYVKNK